MTMKETAFEILSRFRLLERLAQIGKPSVVGSLRMDLMVSRDIDIDVDNSTMSLAQLYGLTAYILEAFHPVWYEAKEEVTNDGRTVWFQGFEAVIDRALWNFDIWFFDRDTIQEAERYCDQISRQVAVQPGAREAILALKGQLLARHLYSFDQYTSIDVYAAVLEHSIRDLDAFLDQQ